MAKQYLIPGIGILNDLAAGKEYLVPGGIINETASSGGSTTEVSGVELTVTSGLSAQINIQLANAVLSAVPGLSVNSIEEGYIVSDAILSFTTGLSVAGLLIGIANATLQIETGVSATPVMGISIAPGPLSITPILSIENAFIGKVIEAPVFSVVPGINAGIAFILNGVGLTTTSGLAVEDLTYAMSINPLPVYPGLYVPGLAIYRNENYRTTYICKLTGNYIRTSSGGGSNTVYGERHHVSVGSYKNDDGVYINADCMTMNHEIESVIGIWTNHGYQENPHTEERELIKTVGKKIYFYAAGEQYCYVDYVATKVISTVPEVFAADGAPDLVLPMSSFQGRFKNGDPSFLSVVIPGVEYADEIARRLNGHLKVFMVQTYETGESHAECIGNVNLDDVRLDEGSESQSITLSGHRTETYPVQVLTLEGASYRSTINSQKRYRCAPNLYLRPGNTVKVGYDEFTADEITWVVGPGTESMEVAEK